jgi:hypothetical protein
MATQLAPGQILRATIWCQDTEQASANVLHYVVQTVGGSPALDTDFAGVLDGSINAAVKGILANNATYRGIEAQIIWPLPLQLAVSSIIGAGTGLAGVTTLPRQSAAITQWKTATAGRHGRGRSYWPFPPATFNTLDGVIAPAGLTAFQTLHNAVLNFTNVAVAGRTATVALVVYNRVTHVGTIVTAAVTTNKWGTQRRRGTYGRANNSPI